MMAWIRQNLKDKLRPTIVIPLLFMIMIAVMAYTRSFQFGHPLNFGSFDGQPNVEFIDTGEFAGRNMRLLKPYSYTDPSGNVWTAPAGFEMNGASIPQVFWSFVGGPFEGPYRNAAIIHDYYCTEMSKPWQDVHRIFYYASLAAGTEETKAKMLYAAVVVGGPKWGKVKVKSSCFAACHDAVGESNGNAGFTPDISLDDAKELMDWVRANNPSLAEIDGRIITHAMKSME